MAAQKEIFGAAILHLCSEKSIFFALAVSVVPFQWVYENGVSHLFCHSVFKTQCGIDNTQVKKKIGEKWNPFHGPLMVKIVKKLINIWIEINSCCSCIQSLKFVLNCAVLPEKRISFSSNFSMLSVVYYNLLALLFLSSCKT